MILAGDIGGSGLRVGLLDRRAALLAVRHVAVPADALPAGGLEIDPASWSDAFAHAVRAVAADIAHGPGGVRAIAITGMTRTQVLLDQQGRILCPALLAQDARAAPHLDSLRARLPHGVEEAGRIDVFHPLARLWWLQCVEPERAQRLATVLEPKDFIAHQLTGIAASDPVSMARLAAAASSGLIASAGFARGVLPPLIAPGRVIGTVLAGSRMVPPALCGTPVVMLAHDTWTAVLGLGALRPGRAYVIAGTSEATGLLATHAASAEGLLTLDWGERLVQIGGPSQCGGDTLAWLLDTLGSGGSIESLLAGPRSRKPLLFLPWLRGERAPFWDADRRAAFIGLSRDHTAADIAASVLAGIAHAGRTVLERAEAAAGLRAHTVHVGGGGARIAAWAQLRADVLGRNLTAMADPEPGLRGAALAALTALGDHAGLDAAQAALPPAQRVYRPDPAEAARHARMHVQFLAADAALLPLAHALVRGA